jgi:GT2 family glycosyltransferase
MESAGQTIDAPRAVIVAGMHRSGTSALTRVLNLLGVYLGDDLMPPAAGNNETGFWEHRQIQIVHQRILNTLYREWNSCWPLPAGWPADPAIASLRSELIEIVQRDFASHRLWGLKDPRTCFLIDLWRSLLAEMNVRPAMVLIFRNPAEIAKSLHRRDGMRASQAYLLWLWSLLLSERETRGMSRSITSYEALLSNWQQEMTRIGQELDIAWPVAIDEARPEIEKFLSPTYRHNLVDDQALLDDASVPDIIKRAYSAVLAALKGDVPRLSATVDELWEELEKTPALVSQYLLDIEHQHRAVIFERNALKQQVQSQPITEATPMPEHPGATTEPAQGVTETAETQAAVAKAEPESQPVAVAQAEPPQVDVSEPQTSREAITEQAHGSPDGNGKLADENHAAVVTEAPSLGQSRISIQEDTPSEKVNGEHLPLPQPADSIAVSETSPPPSDAVASDATARWMQRWRSRSARKLHKARTRLNDLRDDLNHSRENEKDFQRHALALEWRLAVREARPSNEYSLGLTRLFVIFIRRIFFNIGWVARVAGRLLLLRNPHDAVFAEDLRLLKRSGLFSEDYYRTHNMDLDLAGLNLLEHYTRWGGLEGRNPSTEFDSQWYLTQNPDVTEHGVNPLLHYVRQGAAEGRWPSPNFDPRLYMPDNVTLPHENVMPLDLFLWRLMGRLDLLAGAAPDQLTFGERASVPLRRAGRFIVAASGAAIHRIMVLGPLAFIRDIPMLARQAVGYYIALKAPTPHGAQPQNLKQIPRYEAWLAVNAWTGGAENELKDRLGKAEGLPRISVLMPVYNTPIRFLEMAIESVRRQVYEDWELCIADDNSTDPAVQELLKKWAETDPRIKVTFREENGHISRATNSAAELATGEFLVFLDHDDELTPDALGEVALYLSRNPECDFVYSDSDKIDECGRRYDAEFKPAWSPELLLSYMYFTHLCAVRRSLFEEVGRIRPGFEGSQDYDFALRATEKARNVGHIPQIFYHWRAISGSTALSGAAKPESFDAGERAVQEAMQRRGIPGKVDRPDWAQAGRLGIFATEFPDEGPTVEILIPTKNAQPTLRRCIESLKQTSYKNFTITVLDNDSDDATTLDYLHHCGHRVLKVGTGGKFNFAALNNRGVEAANAEYVLLLNNDTEVVDGKWLSRMVGYARQPDVGAVGARLLYPDGQVQHAGVVHGLHDGLAGHAFKLLSRWDGGYLGHAKLTRNYFAVTAACMLTPRKLYLEQGGLDENRFAVAYNDCDYGYRLVDAGYRCVYVAGAELIHHEGTSRGFKDNPSEVAAYREKYGRRVDPYISPHLSLEDERFHFKPTRVPRGKTKKLRACIVSHSLGYTGAPHTQYEVVMALVRRGLMEPVVMCPQDGPLRTEYERQGVEVHILPEHPFTTACARPELFDEAMRDLGHKMKEKWKTEVVYANTLATVFGVAAASQVGLPSAWNVHESVGWKEHFPAPIADRCLASFSKPYRVIFGSNATRQVYAPFDTVHNFMTIPSALDLDRLEGLGADWTRNSARDSFGLSENELAFLTVGTVCERKGQLDLIHALHRLPRPVWERVRVFIVGDRPSSYSTELARLIKELSPGLRDRTTVISETPEVARFYRAADVFVCSSRIECYPRVTLEAMAFGLPLISTPVFGLKEQIQPGVNGLFYDPGNIEQLAQAMMTLSINNALRQEMAAKSPAVLASLMGFEEAVDRYQQVFESAYLTGL